MFASPLLRWLRARLHRPDRSWRWLPPCRRLRCCWHCSGTRLHGESTRGKTCCSSVAMTALGDLLRKHGRHAALRSDLVFIGRGRRLAVPRRHCGRTKSKRLARPEIDQPEPRVTGTGRARCTPSCSTASLGAGARLVIFDMVFPQCRTRATKRFAPLSTVTGRRVIVGAKFVHQQLVDRQPNGGFPARGLDGTRRHADRRLRRMIHAWVYVELRGRDFDGVDPHACWFTNDAGNLFRASLRSPARQNGVRLPAHVRFASARPWRTSSPPDRQAALVSIHRTCDSTPRAIGWRITIRIRCGRFFPMRPCGSKTIEDGAVLQRQDRRHRRDGSDRSTTYIRHSLRRRFPGSDMHLQVLTAAALGKEYLTRTSICHGPGDDRPAREYFRGAVGIGWSARRVLRLVALVSVSVLFAVVCCNGCTMATGLMPLAFAPLLAFNTGGLTGLIGEYAVERLEKATRARRARPARIQATSCANSSATANATPRSCAARENA